MGRSLLVICLFLAGQPCQSFGQSATTLCAELFIPASGFVTKSQLTDDVRLYAIEQLSADTLLHYSDLKGIQSVLLMNRIVADRKNRVFLSVEGFKPEDAERSLFINASQKTGYADYVIVLRRPPGLRLQGFPHNPFELVHQGSYRFRAEDILYVGANPFP